MWHNKKKEQEEEIKEEREKGRTNGKKQQNKKARKQESKKARKKNGKNKRKRSVTDNGRAQRKRAAKVNRKKGSQIKIGNPNKNVRRSEKFEMNSKMSRKITGKINNNIEALMAAKVMQREGYFATKDLLVAGQAKVKVLKKLQAHKERKHKMRHIKPEKVNVPRI